MTRTLFFSALFLVFSHLVSAASMTPVPTASVASSPAPESSPMVVVPVNEAEKASLLKDFAKAQLQEDKNFARDQSAQTKQFKATQIAKQKAWRQNEKRVRRVYFDQHMSGPERRNYVQEYLQRKENFEASLKVEAEQFRKSWDTKLEQLKQLHVRNKQDFQKSLDQNTRPSKELWPKL